MKKLIIILILFSFSTISLNAQNIDSLQNIINGLETQLSALSKTEKVSVPNEPTMVIPSKGASTSWGQKTVIMLPVILFLLVFAYVTVRLKRENYNLKDALAESPVTLDVPNPNYNSADPTSPQTIKQQIQTQSSSRLIGFISGLTSIIIAISMVTYFFYTYYKTGEVPNLDDITNIILSLGIGVTPYAINKITDAVKKTG